MTCRCIKPKPTLTLSSGTFTIVKCVGRHCAHTPECFGTTMRLVNEFHNRP